MNYDPYQEQVALGNIERCEAAIRCIDELIEQYKAEREEWEEKCEQYRSEAAQQHIAFEEDETRRAEREVR